MASRPPGLRVAIARANVIRRDVDVGGGDAVGQVEQFSGLVGRRSAMSVGIVPRPLNGRNEPHLTGQPRTALADGQTAARRARGAGINHIGLDAALGSLSERSSARQRHN